MRKQIVKAVFKKEMLDLFRDKKTLFMMVFFPIILYPLIMIGTSQITMISLRSTEDKVHNVVLDFEADDNLKKILKEHRGDSGKLKLVDSENPEADLREDKISAYVIEENLNQQMNYKVFMKMAKDDSSNAASALIEVFNKYNDSLVKKNIEYAGLNTKATLEPIVTERIDISKGEEMAGYFLGMILPFMLIIGIMMGAIYPAIDIMAGEKERGTLETLLTLPLTNLELIVGKYLAVATISVLTTIINALGMVLSMVYMVVAMGAQGQGLLDDINLSRMIMPAIIAFVGLILVSLMFSAVSMIVCSLASSYKEAQNYVSPLSILGMLPAMITMVPTITLNPRTAMIPVGNVALLIKGVLTFEYDITSIAIVILTNIGFVVISIWLLARLYNTESILFKRGHGFSFLQKRSELIGGKMPTLGDSLAVYGISLLAFLYIGSLLQVKFELLGIALSQLIIIGIPLWLVYYTKAPARKVFRTYMPRFKYVLSGILLWISAFIFSNLLTQLTLYFFPQNLEVLEEINNSILSGKSVWIALIVIAVFPAICEEVLFRGYLFSAASEGGNFKRGIIISSLMFGAMHLYPIKILPTAILGACFAYITYKSSSIFIGMFLHFINNALAVMVLYYPDGKIGNGLIWFEDKIWLIIAIGIVTFIGGLALINLKYLDD
ncbi:MAG: CPBP family intramembrane metalloprotease [Epulopiscium sp.]|nr:CPBP family intramembrane metalloprotease [Candidatus Epulonipiscium sp.]